MSFARLTTVEMRHALHRRLVRWMIAVALAGCAVMGLIAFLTSGDPIELARADEHPAILGDWWARGAGEGFLLVAAIYLAIGAAICGASVAGAEWKWGTVTTALTWEPRRVRLHLARTLSAGVLAFFIGLALQVIFFVAALPAVFAHGNTAGVDGAWWIALGTAMVRIAFMTALVAVLALNIATLGRNTAAALVALSVWMIALEGLVRGLRPGLARFLITENVVILVPWKALDNVEFHRTPGLALATVSVYLAVVVGITTLLFSRRDVAAV